MRLTTTVIITIACTFTLACAQTLMLDFGPQLTSGPGVTNSPGHVSGVVPGSETTWNQIVTGDNNSLEFSDGTAATGISVNLGTESSAGSNLIDFNTNPSNNGFLGGGTNGSDPSFNGSALFGSGTYPGNDGTWGAMNAANGLRIDGLSAGTYEIFFVGWNSNANEAGQTMNVYAGAGASGSTFDFSSLSAAGTSVVTNTSTWVAGENHTRFTVNLSGGDSLFLANDVTGISNNRGFLNSVQIATVPEASTLWLAGISLGVLAMIRRRT